MTSLKSKSALNINNKYVKNNYITRSKSVPLNRYSQKKIKNKKYIVNGKGDVAKLVGIEKKSIKKIKKHKVDPYDVNKCESVLNQTNKKYKIEWIHLDI